MIYKAYIYIYIYIYDAKNQICLQLLYPAFKCFRLLSPVLDLFENRIKTLVPPAGQSYARAEGLWSSE